MGSEMKAWQLIEKPENWCKGANARNATGEATKPRNPDACSWCPVGAILMIYGYEDSENSAAFDRLRKAACTIPRNFLWDITEWNDHPERAHTEILAAMKAADV